MSKKEAKVDKSQESEAPPQTPPTTPEPSIKDLEATLKRLKDSRIQELQSEKASLEARMGVVINELKDLTGTEVKVIAQAQGLVNSGKFNKPGRESSLPNVARTILEQSKPQGLTLQELNDRILQTGYKSVAKNFKSVLYQTLYKLEDVVRDEKTGLYNLQ